MKEAVVNILQWAETATLSLHLKMLYGKGLGNLVYKMTGNEKLMFFLGYQHINVSSFKLF